MKKRSIFLLVVVSIFLLCSIVQAEEYALDIKTDKQMYAAGEEVTFEVLLLKNATPYTDTVELTFSDALDKQRVNRSVSSNQPTQFLIEKEFTSGYWKIEANYQGKNVKRFFSISEREEVEFSIVGDKLIIKNNGNVPYTKTVQILIGEKIVTQKQNIKVGDFKEIRLVAPDGTYNIQVTDGTQTISRSSIRLSGTGNVIGAVDQNILDNAQPLLGGARTAGEEESFSLGRHISPAFIFIGAVGVLALLIFMERMARSRASRRVTSTVDQLRALSS